MPDYPNTAQHLAVGRYHYPLKLILPLQGLRNIAVHGAPQTSGRPAAPDQQAGWWAIWAANTCPSSPGTDKRPFDAPHMRVFSL